MLFSPTEPFVSDDSLRLAQRLQFGPDRRLHLGAVAHEAPQGLDPALARSALPLVTFQGHWTVRATLPWFESETQTVGDGPCLVLRLLSNAAWPGTQGALRIRPRTFGQCPFVRENPVKVRTRRLM